MTGLRLIATPDIASRGFLWLGASSFEDRCQEAATAAARTGAMRRATVIQYATDVRPIGAATARIEANRSAIVAVAQSAGAAWGVRDLFAYRMGSIRKLLDESLEIAAQEGLDLVVDCSCITKIHCVAVAEWMHERAQGLGSIRCFIQYASPLQYGWQDSVGPSAIHFSELVYAPLGEGWASVGEEADSGGEPHLTRPRGYQPIRRVIALVGHEGNRLRYALASLKIDHGFAVLASRREAEDDTTLSRLENAAFLHEIERGHLPEWEILATTLDDVEVFAEEVRDRLDGDHGGSVEVVIVPLGPKPLVLQAVLTALAITPQVYVSYPVPSRYPLTQTDGVAILRTWRVVGRDERVTD